MILLLIEWWEPMIGRLLFHYIQPNSFARTAAAVDEIRLIIDGLKTNVCPDLCWDTKPNDWLIQSPSVLLK